MAFDRERRAAIGAQRADHLVERAARAGLDVGLAGFEQYVAERHHEAALGLARLQPGEIALERRTPMALAVGFESRRHRRLALPVGDATGAVRFVSRTLRFAARARVVALHHDDVALAFVVKAGFARDLAEQPLRALHFARRRIVVHVLEARDVVFGARQPVGRLARDAAVVAQSVELQAQRSQDIARAILFGADVGIVVAIVPGLGRCGGGERREQRCGEKRTGHVVAPVGFGGAQTVRRALNRRCARTPRAVNMRERDRRVR